ncbi:MAG: acyl carrier protein [Gammaproteobacteria bacterium]|nr:acyl carrier protein [Gammaproteobacteria bacterium]
MTTTTTATVIDALKWILADEMDLGLTADQINATVPLLEDGLNLDSIAIVELIAVLEERFAFQFHDADLRTASFANLEALAKVITARTAGREP